MNFPRELAGLVSQIPRGRVATAGDLAVALGNPAAAASVFHVLRWQRLEGDHRVVHGSGEVLRASASGELATEGVRISRGSVLHLDTLRFQDFHSTRPLSKLREEQRRLASRVRDTDAFHDAHLVAGFDVAYEGENRATAAAVVVRVSDGRTVQTAKTTFRVSFPYIPGYLSYRELPGIARCYGILEPKPDVLMVDGHGLLHPARFGIACHVGLRLSRPTIGVGKSLLVGEVGSIPEVVGGTAEVRIDGELRGYGLRSSRSRRLIYVSVGHGISLRTAVDLTRNLCTSRIPEPIRRAHALATKSKTKTKKKKREDG